MRRLMVAATLVAAAFAATACVDQAPSNNGAPATAAVTSTLSANSLQVCQAAEKVIGDSATQFGSDMVNATKALQNHDASASSQATKAVKDLLTSWASGLRQQAGLAEDPNLKSALTDMATEIDTTNGQINTINDLQHVDLNSGKLKDASDRLTNSCK